MEDLAVNTDPVVTCSEMARSKTDDPIPWLWTFAKMACGASVLAESPFGGESIRSEETKPITSKPQTPTPNAPAKMGLASKPAHKRCNQGAAPIKRSNQDSAAGFSTA